MELPNPSGLTFTFGTDFVRVMALAGHFCACPICRPSNWADAESSISPSHSPIQSPHFPSSTPVTNRWLLSSSSASVRGCPRPFFTKNSLNPLKNCPFYMVGLQILHQWIPSFSWPKSSTLTRPGWSIPAGRLACSYLAPLDLTKVGEPVTGPSNISSQFPRVSDNFLFAQSGSDSRGQQSGSRQVALSFPHRPCLCHRGAQKSSSNLHIFCKFLLSSSTGQFPPYAPKYSILAMLC